MNAQQYSEALVRKDKRIAELEAHAEHDEDNLEGLQHALVRANQQYTQAEAEAVVQRELRRTDNAAGAKLDAELRARIAALDADLRDTVRRRDHAEAERDALRCCGNCNHIGQWGDEVSCEAGSWVHTMPGGHSFETKSVGFADHCHFTPSRWAERIAP